MSVQKNTVDGRKLGDSPYQLLLDVCKIPSKRTIERLI